MRKSHNVLAICTSLMGFALIGDFNIKAADDNEVNQLEARIDAVTPEMAKQVIQKHFPLDNLVFVMVGKASEIKPALRKYAEKQDARSITEPGYWPPVTEKR